MEEKENFFASDELGNESQMGDLHALPYERIFTGERVCVCVCGVRGMGVGRESQLFIGVFGTVNAEKTRKMSKKVIGKVERVDGGNK